MHHLFNKLRLLHKITLLPPLLQTSPEETGYLLQQQEGWANLTVEAPRLDVSALRRVCPAGLCFQGAGGRPGRRGKVSPHLPSEHQRSLPRLLPPALGSWFPSLSAAWKDRQLTSDGLVDPSRSVDGKPSGLWAALPPQGCGRGSSQRNGRGSLRGLGQILRAIEFLKHFTNNRGASC